MTTRQPTSRDCPRSWDTDPATSACSRTPWRSARVASGSTRCTPDLAANRALLADLLATHLPGAHWGGGPATFLAWLDCRGLGLGDDPAAAFLERGRVAVNSGLPFGQGAGHVRLNYATTPEILTEALERMGRVV